jgi:hypothetical protein
MIEMKFNGKKCIRYREINFSEVLMTYERRRSTMEALFRSIFEAFPDKPTLTINGKCSDCKRVVTINIEPTSHGFGLLGGAFVECSADKYVLICPDCYKVNSRMVEPYHVNPKSSRIIDKKIY